MLLNVLSGLAYFLKSTFNFSIFIFMWPNWAILVVFLMMLSFQQLAFQS
jgi:hypothetical protein